MFALVLTAFLAVAAPHQPGCPHPGPKGGCAHKPHCLPAPAAAPVR